MPHNNYCLHPAPTPRPPPPNSTPQCDVLRPLRLPGLLLGDSRLGGISATISAYESLKLRGYDVDVVLLLVPPGCSLGNTTALQKHFEGPRGGGGPGLCHTRGVSVLGVPALGVGNAQGG